MNEKTTDLDRLAESMSIIAQHMAENTHPLHGDRSDSLTMTRAGWIDTQVNLARLAAYVRGLSASHKATMAKEEDTQEGEG